MTEQHLDLDALADLLAEGADASLDQSAAAQHLAVCATCRAQAEALAAAMQPVTTALAALPAPPLPADVAARLDAALSQAALSHAALAGEAPAEADATGGRDADPDDAPVPLRPVSTLPTGRRAPRAWLPAAAAAVVLVAAGAVGVVALRDDGGARDAAVTAAPLADLARNATGNTYTRSGTELAAALPALLTGDATPLPQPLMAEAAAPAEDQRSSGSPSGSGGGSESGAAGMSEAQADPLARLREPAGLASCLAGLLPQDDDEVRPLALDYAAFEGRPALVVVLPTDGDPAKVDVFVVGAGCRLGEEEVLHFQRLERPRG